MVAERHRTGWDHAGPSKTRQLCKGKALLHWETQVCLKNAGSFDAAPASPRAPARRRPCLRRPKRARRLPEPESEWECWPSPSLKWSESGIVKASLNCPELPIIKEDLKKEQAPKSLLPARSGCPTGASK